MMNRLPRSALFTGVAFLALGIAASCSAPGGTPKGSSSNNGAGGSGASSGSNGSSEGSFVISANSSSGGAAGGTAGCQQFDIKFEPQTPTVALLVDRSGSMFDSGYWESLKTAVLKVVEKTQDKVRYGLTTFTGIIGQQCPLLAGTDGFSLNNYAAIQAAYEAASTKPGAKLETPTAQTINEKIIPDLLAFQEPGRKYILFVTDGEPDRCDDGPPECARDDVVGAVQSAYKQEISTFVFGLGDGAFALHLQDLANAGSGQPVKQPANALFCFNNDWANAKGTYSDVGGTATFYTPDPQDATALEDALSAAVAGAVSCAFDLQGKIEVDVANASLGEVAIDGVPVPYDETGMNGWHMTSATQLELVGEACAQLKNAKVGISFDFPCDIIIPK